MDLETSRQEDFDGPFMLRLLPSRVTDLRMISQLDMVGDSRGLIFWEWFLMGFSSEVMEHFRTLQGRVMAAQHWECTKHHFERFILYFKFPADL